MRLHGLFTPRGKLMYIKGVNDNNSINLFKSGVAKGFAYMLHVLTLPELR